MFQNIGKFITYIGYAVIAIFAICFIWSLLTKMIRKQENPLPLGIKIRMGLTLVCGAVVAGIGDTYRIRMSKDAVLSHFEAAVPYEALTDVQLRNISCAVVELSNTKRNGGDISKYYPVVEKYLADSIMQSLGYPEEQAIKQARSIPEELGYSWISPGFLHI